MERLFRACAFYPRVLLRYLGNMRHSLFNDKIERVQKRTVRILFPEKHYSDAQSCANGTRLKEWDNIQAVLDSRLHHHHHLRNIP